MGQRPPEGGTTNLGAAIFGAGIWVFCVLVGSAVIANAEGIEPFRCARPPAVDGKLDDPCWTLARFRSFPDAAGSEGTRTEFALARDEWGLFVAFRCHEPDLSKVRSGCEVPDGLFEYFRPDDWVEVLIDPGNTGHDYYWLLVNPAGRRTDLACFADPDRSWNGEWLAGADRGEGAWTAEVFVPIAALNRQPVASEWRINVARRRGCTGKRTVWAAKHRQPTTWPTLVGFEPSASRFSYRASELSVIPTDRPGEGKLRVELENLTGADVDLRPVFRVMRPGSARGYVPHGSGPREDVGAGPLRIAAGATGRVEGLARIDPEETILVQAAVFDHRGNLVFCTPDVGVRLKCRIGGPGPRFSYYTDEDRAGLRFDLRPPTGRRDLRLSVRANGRQVWSAPVRPGEQRVQADIDLTEIPEGRHRIVAQLTGGGTVLAERAYTLTKLAKPSAGSEVKVDRWSRSIVVNGRPFVPVGNSPLIAHGIKYARSMMGQMATNGFNSMHLWGAFLKRDEKNRQIPEFDLDKLRACFAGARESGLKVLLSLGALVQNNPDSPFRKFDLSDDKRITLIQEVVRCVRGRAELLGYEVVDEPEFFVAPEWTERLYRVVKALDPYHFVTVNNCRGARSTLTYARSSDTAGVDYYPCGVWPAGTVGPLTSEVVHLAGHRPVKMWVQGYKIFKPRAPTPDELKMMSWSMLARGASTLFYFIGRPRKELWQAQGECARHIRSLTDAVAAPHRIVLETKGPSGSVYASFRRRGGRWWVIAVNEGDQPCEVVLALPDDIANGTVRVLFEDRRLEVARGLIRDRFTPFGRHVYSGTSDADQE